MRCLHLAPTEQLGIVDDPGLDGTTERHKITLTIGSSGWQGHPIRALERDPGLRGLIIEMYRGWVGRDRLQIARAALRRDCRVWVYWPHEQAIECVDRERLKSLWRHWLFITVSRRGLAVAAAWSGAARRVRGELRRAGDAYRYRPFWQLPQRAIRRALRALAEPPPPVEARSADTPPGRPSPSSLSELETLIAQASPVAFPRLDEEPGPRRRIGGCGAYLRTDFWARIESGGSYGHTCYVAKELAAVTERFVCFMAHRYRLLDDYGVRQVALDPPGATASEDDIVAATPHFYRLLKPAFEALRPAYLYERLCLGNYAGALLSLRLNIPYIVEYNGSEVSMRRSFDRTGYVYEAEYVRAEELAFRQATMISVISEEVKSTLIARGIDPDKILVNPNGADLTAYAPADASERARIRAEVGLDPDVPVVGFTGTFGGWHGVDVLADAIPTICERAPRAHFLLIGDGNYKHLVDAQVAAHALQPRVRSVGRVPQADGARFLKACDIYVSPHNSHMIDSRFFGSPTKIFEYLAMRGGIVASDLEQIGATLSPALSVADLKNPSFVVSDERAVLCAPGDVAEFADAVVGLLDRPDLWAALGRNAREAVEQHYSWTRHVARLWPFLAGERVPERLRTDLRRTPRCPAPETADVRALAGASMGPARATQMSRVATGDAYKDEVQRQWDNDPAGSHYVTAAEPHTLSWFLEAEAYRYAEYAPWMAETMEFARHAGERVLEIGGGMGTDLAQFARHGALVTDIDLSSGHLELAKENFSLRGLHGEFVHHDAEALVFDDDTFDVVYSNGVLHHTPNTRDVVREIHRVLKTDGRAMVMMYAEGSLHYWRNLVWAIGLKEGQLNAWSMGEIMSRSVERSDNAAARPLVKVYTKQRLQRLFDGFADIQVVQRQMVAAEVPRLLAWVPLPALGRMLGWNLIVKARKPAPTPPC